MRTECPYCGQHYDLDEAYIGQEVTCEICGRDFIVSNSEIPPVAPPPPSLQPMQPEPEPEEFRCPFCGGELAAGVKKCRHCGEWLARSAVPKDPVIYVILALTLGFFGVHNFYSGARNRGFIKILLSLGLPCAAKICGAVCFIVVGDSAREIVSTLTTISYFIVMLGLSAVAIWNIREMIDCHSECDKERDVRLLPAVYILSAIGLGWCGVHNFYSGAKRGGLMKLIASICFYPVMATIIFIGNAIIRWQFGNATGDYIGRWEAMKRMSDAQNVFFLSVRIIAVMYILAFLTWIVIDIVNFCKDFAAGNDKYPPEA